jgi:hypothetical protein
MMPFAHCVNSQGNRRALSRQIVTDHACICQHFSNLKR